MINVQKINLYLFVAASFISLLGSGIQAISLPLYIMDLTKSTTMMGVFTFAGSIPFVLLSIFSGYLGDTFNRKKIMVVTDFLQGIFYLTIMCFSIL